jgi:hypothetical protein
MCLVTLYQTWLSPAPEMVQERERRGM